MRQKKPTTVVLGSSRSMQVRGEFINGSFANLGGSIGNVTDLEDYANFNDSTQFKPELTLFFVDPVWFISNYEGNEWPHQEPYPNFLSLDIFIESIKFFRFGNWLSRSFDTNNLGIFSILNGEGFSNDGSYNYTKQISEPHRDANFRYTLTRIKNGTRPFEKATDPDSTLLIRACSAISKIKKNTGYLIIISPPFASAIWNTIGNDPNFSYIRKTHLKLSECLDQTIYAYLDMAELNLKNDCEFIDGNHGGDVTYARILLDLSKYQNRILKYININYLIDFINKEKGYAGGLSRHGKLMAKEIDFLNLGCKK
jgi:hypothetical protein